MNLKYCISKILTLSCLISVTFASALTMDDLKLKNADLLFKVNWESMRTSKLYKQLKTENENKEAESLPGQPDFMKPDFMKKALKETLGLEEKDFQSMMLSADLSNIDLEAKTFPESKDFDVLLGLQVSKGITLDQLKGFADNIKKTMNKEQSEGPALVTKMAKINKTPVLLLEPEKVMAEDAGTVPSFAIGFNKSEKLLFAGTKNTLKSVLEDKVKTGKFAKNTQTLRRTVSNDAEQYLVLSLPPAFKEKLRKMFTDMMESPNQQQAMIAQQLLTLSGAYQSTEFNDDGIVFSLGLQLDKDKINALKTTVDTMVIGMLRMTLSMQMGGQTLPFLSTLRTVVDKAGVLTLTTTFTKADIDAIKDMQKQMQQQPPMPKRDAPVIKEPSTIKPENAPADQ